MTSAAMLSRERVVSSEAARAATWVTAVLLILSSPHASLSQDSSPNLRPFRPVGWSDAIVVSNRQEDNVDTPGLKASDRIYVDFAIINDGGSSLTESFRIDLYVDGHLRESFEVEPPLHPRSYRFLEDFVIRRLAPGSHTLRIVADAGEAVSESNESDNDYTRTIIVRGDCFPLTTKVTPEAAGVLTASRELNCGSVRMGIPKAVEEDAARELGTGGEPVVEASKARSLRALRNRIRSEGRVKVIVGLRTTGQPVVATATGLRAAETRTRPIAQAQRLLSLRMSGHNISSMRRFKFIPYVAMEVDSAALEALATDPEVISVAEDGVVYPLLAESTAQIGAPHAWSQGYSGDGRTVAVLDTGVDGGHPFLTGKVVSEACYSYSFCPGGVGESVGPGSGGPCPSTLSDCFHGTAMAGVAAGRGTDFSGVARQAQIIAIQVFSQCGEDCINSDDSHWIQGLERVLELSDSFDIAAVNLSLGRTLTESENCDSEFPAVKEAMDNLRAAGIATVAASGNAGSPTAIDFPACISSAVSVGSTDDGSGETTPDAVSDFSNSSPLLDLLAPGRWITTSTLGDEFHPYRGTSLATPHVTGAWAVLKSKAPRASVADLLSVLKVTGIPIADPRNDLVRPRIQVDAALDSILAEMPYSSGTLLTLTATPNPGFRFGSWRDCDSPDGNRCVVDMDSVHNVTAFFEPMADNFPDLVTTSLMGPPTATVGSRASISVGIRNQGPANAGPFRLGLYLSADTTITTDDTWFAACSYEAGLLAGESETCRRSFPIPPRVSPGRYYLGAIVDDLDRVAEKSETNNARTADSGPLEVLPPPITLRPDLITTSLMGPTTAAVGTEASISAGIGNQGATDAGPFRLGLYLSGDTAITTDDTRLAACSYEAGLLAGESETCSGSFPIPPRVSPGRYYLGAIVDDLDRVAEKNETNNARVADSGPMDILAARILSRSFIPVLLTAAGRRGSFFTSELTLTNRGFQEARLDYTYTAHAGGGNGTAFDLLAPGEQRIESDALGYLQRLGIPIPVTGNRIGTLAVEALATEDVGVLVRTRTLVPEGRAGLAYPGVAGGDGFEEPVYLCGLRQNDRDRSNVAFQNMGAPEEGAITLRTTVYSGDAADASPWLLGDVTLEPGGFHQYTGLLGVLESVEGERQGYVKVERVAGTAPFYVYGVINDQANSDGSFVFPVTASSLEGSPRHTLPVIVETRDFTSELTMTNFSEEVRTLHFEFLADGLTSADRTVRFSLRLESGQQRIIPDVIDAEMRQKRLEGVAAERGGLAGTLFARAESGDMSGIVIGARTSSSDGRGGRYGVFYNAVPDGSAFTATAWVDGLQQDGENRSNLALVNTGEVDDSPSVFGLDIYSGETGQLVRTIMSTIQTRRWRQINSILANHAPGTTQGYIRVRQVSGNNPFLAYGVVNDGGAPGQRSGDGAFVPGRE